MKTTLVLLSLLSLGWLVGCRATEDPVAPTTTTPASNTTVTSTAAFDTTGQRLVNQGSFVSNVHPASGQVKVYEKAGKRTLVFTNFKTDNGPDLRIYIAENTGLRNSLEITRLPDGGQFNVALPAEADPTKQRFVLIWCKAFSVLFGNAELK
jgi:hypothetical protein